MESPTTEEKLKRLSYADLKKYAKIHGVKANMKAGKIISALLTGNKDNDSFNTMEQQIINSSKKNKEEKFNKDKAGFANDTPRRETYTVEKSEILRMVENVDAVMNSASPELDSSNVTLTRGSERKLRNRKVSFVTPIKTSRVSTSSPKYGSLKDRPKTPKPSRVSGNRRVSFVTPHRSEAGPKRSLPSTPHPMPPRKKTRISVEDAIPAIVIEAPVSGIDEQTSTKISTSTMQEESVPVKENFFTPDIQEKSFNEQFSTPVAKLNKSLSFGSVKRRASEQRKWLRGTPRPTIVVDSQKKTDAKAIEKTVENLVPSSHSVKHKRPSTPRPSGKKDSDVLKSSNHQKIITPRQSGKKDSGVLKSSNHKKMITPKQSGKKDSDVLKSSNRKKIITPNFKAIHEKAFNKMESIDEYQKRKVINSAKKIGKDKSFHSRLPAPIVKKVVPKAPELHSGIPFVPTVIKTKNMNLNFQSLVSNKSKEPLKKKSLPVVENGNKNKENAIKNSDSNPKPISKKRNLRFDLKASLSRKLPYKPHSGPLKPVPETNLNSTFNSSCIHKQNDPVNHVVLEKRSKSREFIRGVRSNRRFELQMSKRAR